MSLLKDLPPVPAALLNMTLPRGIQAATDDGRNLVLEALQTVGAQIKEHRFAIDAQLSEVKTTMLHTQQVVAKINNEGGGGGGGRFSPSVSAQVLEGKESALEEMRSGATKKMRVPIASLHTGPAAAVISSPGFPGVAERDQEIYGPLPRMMGVRDLLLTRPTKAASIEYLRGTRGGVATVQAIEGDAKAELAMAFTLQTSPVRTIACWVPASRQVLDDAAMLGDYIDSNLLDALRLAEDEQLLKGNGIGSNLQGLMTLANPYNRAVAGDSIIDTVRRAITQVQLARGMATGIVVNPALLESLELEKDLEGRYISTFNVTDNNGRTVSWRVPVVVTDALAEGEFLVGDFLRAARLYDRQQATVEVSTEHADFFTRNLVAVRAEERVALTINRPDLLVIGNFELVP